jgi:tripartite-type tricarboxylate transporter receptor subunit TctC
MKRRDLLKLPAVVALSIFAIHSSASTAVAQDYPSKPIRFLVPFPPGGGTDLMSRALAQRITEQAKWSFVLDNKPGAGGSIGVEQAARAAPDGYTIVMGQTSNLALNPTLNPKLPYDPVKDLRPVSLVASGPLMLVASSGWRLADLNALIADAKANPGKVLFGSPGNGTTGHLGGELFKVRAGIDMQHIPYRGASQALTDVLGGRLDLYVSTIPAALGQIKGGKLKGIAVMGLDRLPDLPAVPTVHETVAPGFEVTNWYGVLVPAATPQPIIDRLAAEVVKALASDEVRAKLAGEGVAPRSSTPEAFGAHIKAEIAKWAPVIKASGVTME